MHQLSADNTFHFEMLRVLGTASYGGADVGELLAIADHIKQATSRVGSTILPAACKGAFLRGLTAFIPCPSAFPMIDPLKHCLSQPKMLLIGSVFSKQRTKPYK